MKPDDEFDGAAAGGAAVPTDQVAADPADTAPTLAAAAAEAERKRDEYLDLLLRKTAEFDNYRRRVERERRDLIESAGAEILTDLLAVVDDFERALEAPAAADDVDAYRRGVELIHRQLLDLLRKRGVTPVESLGEQFDPHVHQAVDHESTEDRPDGEVLAVYRRGYRLGDRLLRPAMVKVARGE
jgi:molecular chaperone GrpE